MRPEEGLQHLASLPPSAIKMGLARVRAALERLGHPEREVPALQVAGTNGKGSTCALVAACLGQRYRVGLYTSPHLIAVNERFRLRGLDVGDGELGQAVAEVVDRLGGPEHGLTYFELGTLVAFWLFARARLELAVLETGLGGRLDATTACAPRVTCITPLSLDHQAYLGDTLAAIAGEKAGILKPGAPLVSSRQRPEAREVLEAAATRTGVPLVLEGRDFSLEGGTYRGPRRRVEGLATPLRGAHQLQNLAVAAACLEQLEQAGYPLSDEQWRAGVASTRWPGRLEEVPGTRPPVVLDGAHNPAGVAALLQALDAVYPGRPVDLVFGVFADKEVGPMVAALFPRCRKVYLAPLEGPRGLAPEALAARAPPGTELELAPSAAQALARARSGAPAGGLVLVAGSLSLVGQLRAVLATEGALTR